MNYIFVLKKEKNEMITKFNKIKKWFISNIFYKINAIYVYDNEIDISAPYFNSFYMISPNIFPMLNSCSLDNVFKIKNSICDDIIYPIICLELNKSIEIRGNNTKISLKKLYNLLKFLPNRVKGLVKKYNFNIVNNREWFYIEDTNIPNFLEDMKNKYFTWENMNQVKLKIAYQYPKIIYYDGKNKYESKKMVEKWSIKTPINYKKFLCLTDITQEEINNLPTCIIKPTNWDGGKYIFKNYKENPLNALHLQKDLVYFSTKNRNKEIMGLILRTHKPSIIAEEYIKDLDSTYTAPCELKFYLFYGKILFILATNRKLNNNKFSFFDEDFNEFEVKRYSFSSNQLEFIFEKPHYFDKLKENVKLIYENFERDMNYKFIGKFIRIDFFINKEDYWFGEFSLFPNGGKGDNLNDFDKKTFIRSWIPEVFEIFGE